MAPATPQEQQEYLKLFEETLIRNLSARFGEYQGVRFTLGRTQQRTEEDVLVNTIIERPNSAPFSLDWRVGEVGGQPRVVDVIAEGTSLRLTQRSEYSSVIQRNNGSVAALLARHARPDPAAGGARTGALRLESSQSGWAPAGSRRIPRACTASPCAARPARRAQVEGAGAELGRHRRQPGRGAPASAAASARPGAQRSSMVRRLNS